MRLFTLAGVAAAPIPAIPPPPAQYPGRAISAGPGRITCETLTHREVGVGMPVKQIFRPDIEALVAADKDRRGKQCEPSGNRRRIVTVREPDMGDPMTVEAATIIRYT